ncbi:MAG TPA: single-stranded-DNA-specific exonuclease RecJ [Baekduia sp.]|nr:single-stranded-DNA-specific exonuclease RecJ [Baekduia sp.]
MLAPRLDVPPCDSATALSLARDLGVSFPVAQVLVRRGLGALDDARGWMAAADEHQPSEIEGIDRAVELILRHVPAGRITVHGDYDVDGVTSTAILVRTLRAIGADVDWYLPSRSEDGYGLSVATVERLAARGTSLLLTADCGITAVQEVALARSLGLDVVVSDHHSARADGALPDAPIVHPAVCDYPCPDLCAGGVAYKLAAAVLAAAGHDAAIALADLDLVALATIADCVPLRGENRRLVRLGLMALARTEKVGLRALMRVAQVDPSRMDARAVGFRLAPRLNAAGRLHRADAALELLLTHDEARATEIAEELDRANADRRFVEQRILFEAEAQVAQLGPPEEHAAYVLWGEGWHPGVIGIVASRIAERHHRPTVLVALRDGEEEGTGSGRSIPAFDLLGGLDAAAGHLVRYGGHRAAAGCTVRRSELDAFRAAFVAHAEATLSAEDLVPVERVDAVVAGDELGQGLAEELERLAPFGVGNPSVSLLVPAARLVDPAPIGEGKHLRFTLEAGGVRARAVAFGVTSLPEGAAEGRLHATFGLELNEFRGAVEPRLVLRHLIPAAAEAPVLVGEPEPGSAAWVDAVVAESALVAEPEAILVGAGAAEAGDAAPARPLALVGAEPAVPRTWTGGPAAPAAPAAAARTLRDRRGGGLAGTIAALVHTGEPVLVVCADATARQRALTGRLGGFSVCSYDQLAADPRLADGIVHLVALDPPAHPEHDALLRSAGAVPGAGPGAGRARFTHLAWGAPELRFARDVLDRDYALRPGLAGAYRALRDGGDLVAALGSRPAAAAGRTLRVLRELDLAELDGEHVVVPAARDRTELERSPTFRWAAQRHAEGMAWLSSVRATSRAA